MIAIDLEIVHKKLTTLLNDYPLNGGSVLRRHRFVLAHMQLKTGTPRGEIVLHAASLRLTGLHALEDVFKRPFAEWDPHGTEHFWIEVDFSQTHRGETDVTSVSHNNDVNVVDGRQLQTKRQTRGKCDYTNCPADILERFQLLSVGGGRFLG